MTYSSTTPAGNCVTNCKNPMPSLCRRGPDCSREHAVIRNEIKSMNRIMAIVEREMRKFFRSPALMMASMIMPLVQLIILGNAFGGKIRDARLAIVDEDGGTQALKIREAFDSVRANIRTFVPVYYTDEKKAMHDVRDGKLDGAVIIPPQYSRRVYEQNHPQIALVVDNSDNFMSSALESELNDLVTSLNQPMVEPRILQQTALEIVELYPYVEYMKYLLPGSLSLAMFVSVMIGGGMLYIDDKARGVHEGYLVTPITKLELVLGLNLAGAIKAVMTGVIICVIGSLIAGVNTIFNPATILGLLVMIILTSLAFNHDVFANGAYRRSTGAARHVRHSEYAALLSQRRDLSHPGISPVVARHCVRRSLQLRGGWLQMPSAERNLAVRGNGRHAVPLYLRGRHPRNCNPAVQAHVVKRKLFIKKMR